MKASRKGLVFMVVVRDDQKGKVVVERWFRTEEAAFRFSDHMVKQHAEKNPNISIDVLFGDSVKEIRRQWPEVFKPTPE